MTSLKPNVQSLAEQIYFWLKERIIIGELKAGERLSVDQIATEIGVSRTPVRDAVNRLALEGMLVVHPRRGTVVGSLSVQDIREVYQIRIFLEPAVAEYAAEHATDQLIADLNELQAEWEKIDPAEVYRDFAVTSRYVEINAAFHQRIAAQTKNRRLEQTVVSLYLQPRMATLIFGSNYQGPYRRMQEHRAIIDAIARRDPAGAYRAMRDHLRYAASNLTDFLSEPGRLGDASAR
ncbi:MAG: GntR family transcriptional regulator [Dehalococcoidia bacterium]|nr:MAG: GntR family transcriptional regulator [Dehalococcoidia bacterium]